MTFGVDSFGNGASTTRAIMGNAAAGKKFAPTSLLDAMKRGGAAQDGFGATGAIPRSPAQPARAARSGATGKDLSLGGGVQLPMQSLRDSPFMRQAPTSTRGATHSTPAAAASAARISTPFASDASPIRPLMSSLASAAATPANKPSEEQKNTAAADTDNRLFDATPLETTWTSALATPAHALQAVAPVAASDALQLHQNGLGFGGGRPCAVTVFGFAPHQAASVLSKFHSFGEILSREDGASESGATANWVHLLYRTPVAASMAIAQNGRIIGGTMIGVKPRADAMDASATDAASDANNNGSIFDRTTRNRHTSSSTLTAASIYATPQSAASPMVRKSVCTKLMEALFNY